MAKAWNMPALEPKCPPESLSNCAYHSCAFTACARTNPKIYTYVHICVYTHERLSRGALVGMASVRKWSTIAAVGHRSVGMGFGRWGICMNMYEHVYIYIYVYIDGVILYNPTLHIVCLTLLNMLFNRTVVFENGISRKGRRFEANTEACDKTVQP